MVFVVFNTSLGRWF